MFEVILRVTRLTLLLHTQTKIQGGGITYNVVMSRPETWTFHLVPHTDGDRRKVNDYRTTRDKIRILGRWSS